MNPKTFWTAAGSGCDASSQQRGGDAPVAESNSFMNSIQATRASLPPFGDVASPLLAQINH